MGRTTGSIFQAQYFIYYSSIHAATLGLVFKLLAVEAVEVLAESLVEILSTDHSGPTLETIGFQRLSQRL